MTTNKLPEWRAVLDKCVENYQSTRAWYEENRDNPAALDDTLRAEDQLTKFVRKCGFSIVLDLLDEVDNLRGGLQERRKPVITFYSEGIAAAANWVDQQRESYDNEHGRRDNDTGSFEFGNDAQRDYSDTLAEIAEGIRALHPSTSEQERRKADSAKVANMEPVFFIEIEGDDWIAAGEIKDSLKGLADGVYHLYTTPQLAADDREPVFFVEMRSGEDIQAGRIPGSTFDFNNLPDGINKLYAAPQTVLKDHQIRELVNDLRDIAIEYHGTQQLRERIARTVRAAMLQAGNFRETTE